MFLLLSTLYRWGNRQKVSVTCPGTHIGGPGAFLLSQVCLIPQLAPPLAVLWTERDGVWQGDLARGSQGEATFDLVCKDVRSGCEGTQRPVLAAP